ncbi:uncharacterized protein LOC129749764 [Uranotaenia lowii]|uniref:uncharacterized protein LOC129749764 n=1 Tax=Uranotaenia lowii TaxID=190385 RepID=UPI0024793A3C|nr:uncharacterized protein LOC129749764 [Uranotaenia lowii]
MASIEVGNEEQLPKEDTVMPMSIAANKDEDVNAKPESTPNVKTLGAKPRKPRVSKAPTKPKSKRNPLRTARKRADFHCGSCDERDSSRMVMCDQCEVWYHFSCVEVTSGVANQSTWECPRCETTINRRKSIRNEQRTLVQRQELKLNPDLEVQSISSRKSSRSESVKIAELRLQKLKELAELKQQYIEQKFTILEEAVMEGSENDVDSKMDKMSEIEDWIGNINLEGEDRGLAVEDDRIEEDKHKQVNKIPSRNKRVSVPRNFNPEKRSTPLARPTQLQLPTQPTDCGENDICLLNKSQLAARQALAKDLPEFDGSSEDWPLFISTFNSSTQMCGFTNEENMLRLRKCLRGRAFEAVRSRLLHPDHVTSVMSTLKMVFGRPEAIINAMISKIRMHAPPILERMESIVNFALTVENLRANIEACGVPDFAYNATLRSELVNKLPPPLQLQWARDSRAIMSPSLLHFSSWLYTIAEDASAIMTSNPISKTRRDKKESYLHYHEEQSERDPCPDKIVESASLTHQEIKKKSFELCRICSGRCTAVTKCATFLALDYETRWELVKERRLCRKCLNRHNGPCRQRKPCGTGGCDYLHHHLLHKPGNPETSSPTTVTEERSCNTNQSGRNGVLFRIIPVILQSATKTLHTYAFIDDGSEITLMEDEIVKELDLEGPVQSLCLKWTSGTTRTEKSRKVNLTISGAGGQMKKYSISNVRTVKSLDIRPQTLDMLELGKRFKHLQNVPITSYEDACPRILIGLDNAQLGNPLKSREGKLEEPIAVKTRLGWTVYGHCSDESSTAPYINYHSVNQCPCDKSCDQDLHAAMKNFFAVESLGLSKPTSTFISRDDQRAISLLETHTHAKNGHYETTLLWKYDNCRLPDSKPMALSRWECLEKRLRKDTNLAKVLNDKINDYVDKGYARRLTTEELTEKHQKIWYLPIFPITNPNKPGKTRLVWDAAAKAHGISLNSLLLKGPDQLTSLFAVLLKFREYKVAVCGDIREMYHQVLIRKEDQNCQRFFWGRNEDTNLPHTYIMQVMTFGACSSPCTAQFIKNRNAEKYMHQYPAAANVIITNHYADDMLLSVESESEAIKLAEEVRTIHRKAGFELRNFRSNENSVSDALEGRSKSNESKEIDMDVGREGSTDKVLGMWWDTSTDCFTFKLSPRMDPEILSGKRIPTKREVLRTLMQIFDPLGLVGHFLMFLKCLLQEIWRSSVGWDDPIGDNEFQKWKRWLEILPTMTEVKIPRCYRAFVPITTQTDVQLHTFVDASENGMAAVAYLRFENNGVVECALVSSKTRVSPLKFLSIPRSELQASVIGARLSNAIMGSSSIKVNKRYFWTDSKTVLCWLSSDHRKYSQYVSHRVSDILESTELSEWCWIPSKLNVADDGTKWKVYPDFNNSSRWFRGPDLLSRPTAEWPLPEKAILSTDIELRPFVLNHHVLSSALITVEKFFYWAVLLRKTAYALRYIYNLQRTAKDQPILVGLLTREDLLKGEQYLFRLAQGSAYAEEIELLIDQKSHGWKSCIPRKSPLFKLCAFLDENRVLRIRGRISLCEFAQPDTKNPIILPRNHHITRLIVSNIHSAYHHQNHETIINEIRQRYYIPGLRSLYKNIRKDCQVCKNQRVKPQVPLMSELPLSRLSAYTRPFSYMGIDYFGPMLVVNGRKQEKRWGVLATCLTIRAIHLQVVHSLTTSSCIMAIRNIMSRRGVPICIYSDRGTNFIGADRELKSVLKDVNQNRLMEEFTSPDTQWSFNPPASPHMGGAWERLIRSVKQNMAKLNPNHRPNDEILENMLIEIENIVNSRPLTHVPVEDSNSLVLTPNHFLLGSSNGLKPWVPFDDSSSAVRRSWQLSQTMANVFWRHWVHDYLPTLTRRSKWFDDTKPIEVDDIAVIIDPNLPRNCWPKGRIIATNISPDGRRRWATIQTSTGVYNRPVAKLAILDIGLNNSRKVSSKGVTLSGTNSNNSNKALELEPGNL